MFIRVTCIIIVLLMAAAPTQAQIKWSIDFETGAVFTGYNDVRIPGNTGTEFSLSKDLDASPRFFARVRFSYYAGEKHTLSLLAAPLRINSEGEIDRTIRFAGEEFEAGTPLEARFRFDSYRFTYRYQILKNDKLTLGLGVTAKIRDAAITVWGGGITGQKKNVGFVPLINFRLDWQLWKSACLRLEGDALAAPQGRAEDVLLAIYLNSSEKTHFKVGYRLLEGGADNDEVYTFSWVNYLVIGTVWRI
jgi:hypothetical protein